jgi:hypothetical protein
MRVFEKAKTKGFFKVFLGGMGPTPTEMRIP